MGQEGRKSYYSYYFFEKIKNKKIPAWTDCIILKQNVGSGALITCAIHSLHKARLPSL